MYVHLDKDKKELQNLEGTLEGLVDNLPQAEDLQAGKLVIAP